MGTCIQAKLSLNFGQIRLTTLTELAALERIESISPLFFVSIYVSLFKLAGVEKFHNILDVFEFWRDRTTDLGVICPCASENIPVTNYGKTVSLTFRDFFWSDLYHTWC